MRDVLEATDGGGGQVEVGERRVGVERVADRADLVAREPECRQLLQRREPLNLRDLVRVRVRVRVRV